MLLKLLLCLSCASLVAARSVSDDNERHIIVLNDDAVLDEINLVMEMVELFEGRDRKDMGIEYINFLLPIVFADISKETAQKIQTLPEVKYIEVDQLISIDPIINPEPDLYIGEGYGDENLGASTDRYNLALLNLLTNQCPNGQYTAPNDGTDADIYIIDSGINYDHIDYKYSDGRPGTRAKYGGFDGVIPPTGGRDCFGHGSHCAGIAGGLQSGVAKNANLYSIRVLGCDNTGRYSWIIAGVNFVGQKHEQNKNKTNFVASIASMSIRGPKYFALNEAVNALVDKGVIVVTASGNDYEDACNVSPGSSGKNINVGAHGRPKENPGSFCVNPIASFSNWGRCVDVIAPGYNIKSVDYKTNYWYVTMSGTSMACPHVSGAAALLMKNNKKLTPSQVKAQIKQLEQSDIDRTAFSIGKSQRLHIPAKL